jgi:hypothetical protein
MCKSLLLPELICIIRRTSFKKGPLGPFSMPVANATVAFEGRTMFTDYDQNWSSQRLSGLKPVGFMA